MALTAIKDLGNDSGKIYEIRAGKVRQSYNNSREIVEIMLVRAIRSRIIHPQNMGEVGTYTEAPNDPDASSFKLDSNSGAAALDGQLVSAISSDAIDITPYLIPHSKHPAVTKTIASGVITAERYAPITIIMVEPESGAEDTLDSIVGINFDTNERDFQVGDFVLLLLKTSTDVITTAYNTGDGKLLFNAKRDKYLTGPAAAMLLVKCNGAGWQELGSDDYLELKEVAANTDYDPITDADRVHSMECEVWLNNSGAMSANVTIGSSTAYKGCRINVRPKTAYSSYGAGKTLTVFGIDIPAKIGTTTNWSVTAVCDDTGTWYSWLLSGTSESTTDYRVATSGESSYQNDLLKGKSVGEFIYFLGGIPVTFGGSTPSASFNSGTGTITYTNATDADADALLFIP